MSQNNLTVADSTGYNVRTGFNNSIQSVASLFSGASDPATLSPSCAFAGMLWMDTGNSLIKQRDSANATWIRKGSFDANGTIVWDSIVVANNANFNTITSSGMFSVTSGQTNAPNATEAFYVYVIATSTTNLNQYAIGQTSGNIYSRNNVSGTWQSWSQVYSSVNLPSSNRNKIINGDMIIDQRNNGAAQTFTAGAAVAYCVDRFYASCTGANVTGQQITGTGSYNKSYQITGLASNTGTLFGQRIESVNCRDLLNQNVTCQVELSSNAITTVTWIAYYANVADTFSAKTQISTGTLTITSTPIIYNFSFDAGANARNGIAIEFTTGALLGAKTLTYSGIQFEKGIMATPFEFLIIDKQLASCQRYLPAFNGFAGPIGYGQCSSTTQSYIIYPFKVTPRTAPTGISITALANFSLTSAVAGSITPTSLVYNFSGVDCCQLAVSVSAGLVAGNATMLSGITGTVQIIFTGSEL